MLWSGAQGFSAKLAPNWEGPFEVIEVKPTNVYIIRMNNGRKNPKVHMRELKKREGRGMSRGGVVEVELTHWYNVRVLYVYCLLCVYC